MRDIVRDIVKDIVRWDIVKDILGDISKDIVKDIVCGLYLSAPQPVAAEGEQHPSAAMMQLVLAVHMQNKLPGHLVQLRDPPDLLPAGEGNAFHVKGRCIQRHVEHESLILLLGHHQSSAHCLWYLLVVQEQQR